MTANDRIRARRMLAVALMFGLGTGLASGAQRKQPATSLDHKEFFRPELYVSTSQSPVEEALGVLPNREAWERFRQRSETTRESSPMAYVDDRSGAATNILAAVPLVPGKGVGNRLRVADLRARLGGGVTGVTPRVVGAAVRRFAGDRRDVLGIDLAQLGEPRATQVTPDLWHVSIPQVYQGVPVRHARLAASLSHGNLVVIGTETWGNVAIDTRARITAALALEAGFAYADGRTEQDEIVRRPALEIVPVAPAELQLGEGYAGPVGKGYGHRLVWTFVFRRRPEDARWEVMVDAHSGEVIAFQDLNRYEQRRVTGGVYPLTSTEVCPTPQTCGAMQSGWPMPFADTGVAAPDNFTNSAGVYNYTSGTAATTLTGRYVDIVDNCGAISQSGPGDINLGGLNGQHDCTSGGGSAGDTSASRSAFYEVNRIAEQARGWLPTNAWLQSRLTTNVNINQTCNAFYSPANGTINFYRSGGGCRNTGELAGVFDHEWGHALDDNDTGGALSNSSEAYADIAAIYRLNASCVGHGFFQTLDDGCGQTADGTGYNVNEAQQGAAHCDLDCSGVRDADYLKHSPNTPDTALGFVCTSCLTGPGPCGRQVHCAAAPVRQAAWDLAARDLQAPPFSYDSQTAFIIANKIFYQGSGNVGAWHSCTCGGSASGCGATNGYMQWLAADDDNGNLNDGTPHMTAIHAAYNRHGIACATPTPVNSGCAGQPSGSAGPSLTATAGNYSVSLSWNAVAGATRYWVFRTEGHAGCDFGKTLIADVTGTSYTDAQVANGRPYSYNVVAAGSSSACHSRASSCAQATPTAPANPDFSIACSPSSLVVTQGGTSTASTCTVSSTNGFSSAVSLSCTSLPSGATCSFTPPSVTPSPNGSSNSTLVVSASGAAATGSFNFNVQGVGGSLTRTFAMGLNVSPAGGGGDLVATFDTARQAPACATVGRSCDSGASLLLGRANLGPEPNQPNTINDSCADGTSGVFHTDESNDRLKVLTVDGTSFAPGRSVRIEATVWAWTTPSADRADFFYAADALNPSWTFIGTATPTVVGAQTLSMTYNLPAGRLQAVRVQFRYQSTTAACAAGAYNDRDDLVFAVTSTPVNTVFFDDFETATAWITNPNGTDTATTGLWERGDPEPTDSVGPKQLGTTVSGVNDLVTGRLAGTSAGAHDIDGGVTSIQSPAITLPSSGTLTLSFSYYLAHGTNSSTADFLRVLVVGSTTSQVFQELGGTEDDDAVWATASADIGSFAGQTVRIRIEAADASTASLVEAAVDDVRITQQ